MSQVVLHLFNSIVLNVPQFLHGLLLPGIPWLILLATVLRPWRWFTCFQLVFRREENLRCKVRSMIEGGYCQWLCLMLLLQIKYWPFYDSCSSFSVVERLFRLFIRHLIDCYDILSDFLLFFVLLHFQKIQRWNRHATVLISWPSLKVDGSL